MLVTLRGYFSGYFSKNVRGDGYESISPTKFDQTQRSVVSYTASSRVTESYGGDWVAWTSFVEGMSTLSLDNAMAAC